jgi:hypothetical protein
MKKSFSKPINLPVSIQQHLHTYAVAAAAAGVSVLALAQPAETEIIYTPANAEIYPGGPYVGLDLNGDGTTDFWFRATWFGGQSFASGYLAVHNAQAGNAVVATSQMRWAAVLPAGAAIGSAANFDSRTFALMARGWFMGSSKPYVWNCYGPWNDVHHRFLGLKFMIDGEVHYGWARLNQKCKRGFWESATLTGYAYETIPDQGLLAGEKKDKKDLEGDDLTVPAEATPTGTAQQPATLGRLALGSSALSAWRRSESELVGN